MPPSASDLSRPLVIGSSRKRKLASNSNSGENDDFKMSSDPEPPVAEPSPLCDAPNEIFLILAEHLPRYTNGKGALLNLSKTCKKFWDLSARERYKKLVVEAPIDFSRQKSNVEQLIRTLVSRPDHASWVRSLSINQDAKHTEDLWPMGGCAAPAAFLSAKELKMVHQSIIRFCNPHVFSGDFPTGAFPSRTGQRIRRPKLTGSKAWSLDKVADVWNEKFRAGRQDAVLAVLLALCPNVEELSIDTFEYIMDGEHTKVSNTDIDYFSFVIRGGVLTRYKDATIHWSKRAAFQQYGALRNLKSVSIKNKHEDYSVQTTNEVFNFLVLAEKAMMMITEDRYEQFQMPSYVRCTLPLKQLLLYQSHMGEGLYELIRNCANLEAFRYEHFACETHDLPDFDLNKLVKQLEQSKAKNKLRVLLISYHYFEEATWTGLVNAQVLGFAAFSNLRRVHFAVEHFLDYLSTDNDYFIGYRLPNFDITTISDAPVVLRNALYKMLPPLLKVLEIEWKEFHPRYKQIFHELQDLFKKAGKEGVPSVETVLLGRDVAHCAPSGPRSDPKNLVWMLMKAEKRGVKIYTVDWDQMKDWDEITEEPQLSHFMKKLSLVPSEQVVQNPPRIEVPDPVRTLADPSEPSPQREAVEEEYDSDALDNDPDFEPDSSDDEHVQPDHKYWLRSGVGKHQVLDARVFEADMARYLRKALQNEREAGNGALLPEDEEDSDYEDPWGGKVVQAEIPERFRERNDMASDSENEIAGA